MTADRSGFGDMDPEAFRREAHRVADWIADYLAGSERYPVLAQVRPGAIAAALPSHAPADGESFDAIFADFERVLIPGITHWNHPGFFAYFAITGSAPGILAEFLSAALNVSRRCCGARRRRRRSSKRSRLAGSGSCSACPATSRESSTTRRRSPRCTRSRRRAKRLAPSVRTRGLAGRSDVPRMRVYCSDQTHSSIDKAVILLGHGQESLRKIASDADFRMRPALLAAAIAEDRAAGWQPLAVVATVGTTSSTSIDPLPEIAELCRRESIWLHVDAAYAGVAAMVPGYEWILPRRRARRFARRQPAQVAFHPVRSSRVVLPAHGPRACRVRTDARVSEDRGSRPGSQPDGHGRAARAAVPRAEAMDGDSPLRRGRASRAACGAHAARAALRSMD